VLVGLWIAFAEHCADVAGCVQDGDDDELVFENLEDDEEVAGRPETKVEAGKVGAAMAGVRIVDEVQKGSFERLANALEDEP